MRLISRGLAGKVNRNRPPPPCFSDVWQAKDLQRVFLDVWQVKGLRADFADVWQLRELVRLSAGALRGWCTPPW